MTSLNFIPKIDEKSRNKLGVFTIARSISHRYTNIEVIVSGLLPRDINYSTRRVKTNKTNAYLKNYCKKSNNMTFMRQDPNWTFPDKPLNMELYQKDHLHVIGNGNIKSLKLIIETLQGVLSPQSSQLSSSYFPHS